MSEPMNTRQFLDGLAEQSIVAMDELAKLRRDLAPEQLQASPEALARDLVRRRMLTRFQAVQVYQGRARALVFGEYLVLDKLGEGGMGQVYKAEHRRMKRIVALKVLPTQATQSKPLVERFYKEVELAARLAHANIVTAYDAGESHGLHYLAMEYIDGQDLSSYVKTNGPMPVEQAMNCVLQAARGLQYAHAEGIVHRDVKPSNLMVNRRGVVKILDLGLARIEQSFMAPVAAGHAELTTSGQVLGTVDYMAPEQSYDSRTADHRSDVYSLGCTLYRLLTGVPPYAGETMLQKLLAHREQPVPSLRAARPDVTPALDALYQRMIAKLPDDRPRSMREVVTALESLLAGASDEDSTVTHIDVPRPDDDGLDDFLQRLAGSSGIGSGSAGRSASDTPAPGSSGTIRTGPDPSSGVRRRTNAASLPATWMIAAAATALFAVAIGGWYLDQPVERDAKTRTDARSRSSKQFAKSANKSGRLTEGIPVVPVPSRSSASAPVAASAGESTTAPSPTMPADAAPPSTDAQLDTPSNGAALTAAIDLLKNIDSSAGASSGKFTVDEQGLSGTGSVNVRFSIDPPEEFDLTAVVDNLKLGGECRFALPMADGSANFSLNHTSRTLWSLEVDPPHWPSQRALTLADGPLTIACAVRKHRVYVAFDGKTAVDWAAGHEGGSRPLVSVGARPGLFLQLNANYHVASLQLAPPSTPLPLYAPVDLLARIDLGRDRVSGKPRHDSGDLLLDTTTEQGGSCVALPLERPSEYVVTALVERMAGSGHFDVALPMGMARPVSSIDQPFGSAAIASLANFTKPPDRLLLPPWRLHTIICTVRGPAVVHVEIDGREIIDYQTPITDPNQTPAAAISDPGAFFVRSELSSAFRIRRLEVAPLGWRKLAQPGPEALASAQESIKSMVATQRTPRPKTDEKSALASKLWREAARKLDPAARWALLDASAHLAAEAGDLPLACHAALDVARTFDADLTDWYAKLLVDVFKTPKTTPARQAMAGEALRQSDLAIGLEELGLAAALDAAAGTVKPLPPDVQREIKARGVEIDFWQTEQAAGRRALVQLAESGETSESKTAHLAAGRYLAMVRSDWHAAWPHFEQGGDAELAALIQLEAAPPSPADDQVAAGDRWWELSVKAATPLRWWYLERAVTCYRRAATAGRAKTPLETKSRAIARQRKLSGGAFASRVPLGASKIGSRWYKYYASPLPWKAAESVCRDQGGSLPIIKSLDDNQAVVQALASAARAGASERLTTWLACSDQAKEGEFRWPDGAAVARPAFVNWRAGEPDNAGGQQDFGSMLVMFEKGEIKSDWTDEAETASLPFVCVWEE